MDLLRCLLSCPVHKVALRRRHIDTKDRLDLSAVTQLELKEVTILGNIRLNWSLHNLRQLTLTRAVFTDVSALQSLLTYQNSLMHLELTAIPGFSQSLMETIGRIRSMRYVEIAECVLEGMQWEGVYLNWDQVEEMHVGSNDLGSAGLKGLLSALPTSLPALTVLDLSRNSLGNSGACLLSHWVLHMKLQLQSLAVSENFIGSEGCTALGNMLRTQVTLKKILLAGNLLSDRDANFLISAISSPRLQIDLSCTHITSTTLHFLLTNPQITAISLDQTCLSPTIPPSNPSFSPSALKYLSVSESYLSLDSFLTISQWKNRLLTLDLTKCGLNELSASLLIPVFQGNTELKTVRLGGNSLLEQGISAISEALKGLKRLKTVDLRGNSLGFAGITIFSGLLCNFPELKSLQLSENYIGNEGLLALCENFKHIPRLKRLNLSKNGFNGNVFPRFSESLLNFPCLFSLNLSHNPISDSGLRELSLILPNFLSLVQLNLSSTLISDSILPIFIPVLRHLPVFSHFHCDGNKLSAELLRLLAENVVYLSHISARKNEFNREKEGVKWPRAGYMDLSYSHVNVYASEAPVEYLHTLRISGSRLPTAACEVLFAQCSPQIRVLCLDDDNLKASQLSALHSPFLSHLSLSNALFDSLNCGWQHFSQSLLWLDLSHINSLSSSVSLHSVLQHTTRLRHLAFTHNSLTKHDQLLTLLALCTLTFLEEIEINNVRNRPEFGIADAVLHLKYLKWVKFVGLPGADEKLALAVTNLRNLHSFSIRNFSDFGFISSFGSGLGPAFQLKYLDISGCLLLKPALKPLIFGLNSQFRLTTFKITNCKLENDTILELIQSISQSPVTEFDFSGNFLHFSPENRLSNSLFALKRLENVRLNGIKWENLDVNEVGKALNRVVRLSMDNSEVEIGLFLHLKRVKELSMCNCSLTDAKFTDIFHQIRDFEWLISLELDFNHLTAASLPGLIELCVGKQTFISLRGNNIEENEVEEASAHLEEEEIWLVEEKIVLR